MGDSPPHCIHITGSHDEIEALEKAVTSAALSGTSLCSSDPGDLGFHSSIAETVVLTLGSATALRAVRDIIIAHVKSKESNLVLKNTKSGMSISFNGRLESQRELEALVEQFLPDDSPK